MKKQRNRRGRELFLTKRGIIAIIRALFNKMAPFYETTCTMPRNISGVNLTVTSLMQSRERARLEAQSLNLAPTRARFLILHSSLNASINLISDNQSPLIFNLTKNVYMKSSRPRWFALNSFQTPITQHCCVRNDVRIPHSVTRTDQHHNYHQFFALCLVQLLMR